MDCVYHKPERSTSKRIPDILIELVCSRLPHPVDDIQSSCPSRALIWPTRNFPEVRIVACGTRESGHIRHDQLFQALLAEALATHRAVTQRCAMSYAWARLELHQAAAWYIRICVALTISRTHPRQKICPQGKAHGPLGDILPEDGSNVFLQMSQKDSGCIYKGMSR